MIGANSNLSKIKPKLRTSGRVSGNFGKNRVVGGSQLTQIGVTKSSDVKITPRAKYVERMVFIWHTSQDAAMKQFAYAELHRLNCFEEVRLDPCDT